MVHLSNLTGTFCIATVCKTNIHDYDPKLRIEVFKDSHLLLTTSVYHFMQFLSQVYVYFAVFVNFRFLSALSISHIRQLLIL